MYVGQRPRVGGEVERRTGVEPNVVGTELGSVGTLVVQPVPGVLQSELVGEVAGVTEVVHQQNCAAIGDEGFDSQYLRGGVPLALGELNHALVAGEARQGDGVALDPGYDEYRLLRVVDLTEQQRAGYERRGLDAHVVYVGPECP